MSAAVPGAAAGAGSEVREPPAPLAPGCGVPASPAPPAPSAAREGDIERAVTHAAGRGTVASRGLSRQDPRAGSWPRCQTQPSRELELTGSAGAGRLGKEPLGHPGSCGQPCGLWRLPGPLSPCGMSPQQCPPLWLLLARGTFCPVAQEYSPHQLGRLGTKDKVARGEQEEP